MLLSYKAWCYTNETLSGDAFCRLCIFTRNFQDDQVVSRISADSDNACLPIHQLQEEEVRKVLKKIASIVCVTGGRGEYPEVKITSWNECQGGQRAI